MRGPRWGPSAGGSAVLAPAGRRLGGTVALLLVLLLLATTPAFARSWTSGSVAVIVRGSPGARVALEREIRALGGRVTRSLPIIDGVAANVPAVAVAALHRQPQVVAVTPDAAVHFSSIDPNLGYDATGDFGSMANVTQIADVQNAWKAGYSGRGVDVAMIDSGVAPVQGLTSGNVVNGPDLSFESQDPSRIHMDTFGHGTHMAGIIVGRDQPQPNPSQYADPKRFTGVAPDARLISLKVAAADGGVDVSQVIAAINWVTEHAHDPGFNIRVLNLSFGTDSTQDYRLDPLAYAAEVAWRSGIVVVVAGGNDGSSRTTLANPAMDPYVLAVGAEDPQGTVDTSDDTVPAFATRGTSNRHVDLVAPAVHMISLRDPNGYIDQAHPEGRVGSRFFRGSGTSQATAVASGAAALLLQKYPSLGPDQVKKMLMTTAVPFSGSSAIYRGAGALDVANALAAPVAPNSQSASKYGTGLGSLEQARGTAHVTANGVDLVGEQDIFGTAWNGAVWAPKALAGRTWTGGDWNGHTWTGADWSDSSLLGAAWAGRTWTDNDWTGVSWSSRTWTSRTWTGDGWPSRTWTGDGWASRTWTGDGWGSRTWTESTWAGAGWN